jgi:hypothetical protein
MKKTEGSYKRINSKNKVKKKMKREKKTEMKTARRN